MCELAANLLECWNNNTHECDMYISEHLLQISVKRNPCVHVSIMVCIFGCILWERRNESDFTEYE